MSLTAALNIGRSALTVNQAAIQTVGNNISNVGNPNYTRQTPLISASREQIRPAGMAGGAGVQLDGIRRNIDEALEGRIRNSTSDSTGAGVQEQWLSRMEAVMNELSDQDLSTQLSTFFNSWSDLANKPQDPGLRQIVLQSGQSVATWFRQMSDQFQSLRGDLGQSITNTAASADELASKIAALNTEIVNAEGGGTGAAANGLRDQRDTVLKELAGLIEIRTVQQPNGVTNVYVGSDPLVFDGRSRGVTVVNETIDGRVQPQVIFRENGAPLKGDSGELGGLLKVSGALDQ
ncbi:MAG TPA: flagellar hook-associated protein FlgK, partial [Tepidisphaeraceae bacterium]